MGALLLALLGLQRKHSYSARQPGGPQRAAGYTGEFRLQSSAWLYLPQVLSAAGQTGRRWGQWAQEGEHLSSQNLAQSRNDEKVSIGGQAQGCLTKEKAPQGLRMQPARVPIRIKAASPVSVWAEACVSACLSPHCSASSTSPNPPNQTHSPSPDSWLLLGALTLYQAFGYIRPDGKLHGAVLSTGQEEVQGALMHPASIRDSWPWLLAVLGAREDGLPTLPAKPRTFTERVWTQSEESWGGN